MYIIVSSLRVNVSFLNFNVSNLESYQKFKILFLFWTKIKSENVIEQDAKSSVLKYLFIKVLMYKKLYEINIMFK